MNVYVFRLTVRQLIARRSFLITFGLSLLPIIVALVFRVSDPEDVNPERFTARFLYEGLTVTAVLPLTALLLGVSALGDEFEDGTAVYLLAKPLPRWHILAPKLAAATLLATAIVLPSTLASGAIVMAGEPDLSVVQGFAIGVTFGCVAYTTLFVLLSLVISRALIAGLTYLFIWETTVAALFEGTRYLSIRQHILGIADWFSDTPPSVFNANLGGAISILLIVVVTALAALVAEQRLQQVEVRETT